ncbi:MAG: hypothetical protein R3B09_20325 [Nannocystaceae bacterium]
MQRLPAPLVAAGRPAALLLALAAACDGGPEAPPPEPAKVEPTPAPAPESSPASAPEATPTEPPPPAAKPLEIPALGAPGPAFLTVDGKGIVRVSEGAITALEGAPTRMFRGLQLGGDGAVWVSGFDTVYRLEGDAFREVTRGGYGKMAASIEDFQVTAEGHIWASTFKSVAHYDGAQWTEEDAQTIGAGEDSLKGIGVDREGRVLVASTNKVHLREDGKWRDLDLGKLRGPQYFEQLDLGPDGAAYVRGGWTLLKIPADRSVASSVKIGGGSFASYADLSVAADGSVGVVNLDEVLVQTPDGKLHRYSARRGKDFHADKIRALGVGDGGRIWVGSDTGVSILGGGGPKVEWPSGSVPELAGEIEHILVLGAGPSQLPGAGPLHKGGLRGRILQDGAPMGGLEVEVCPSPDYIYTRSPCHDASVKFKAKSGDDGVWTVEEVPLGAYGVAVKVHGKWQITLGASVSDAMKEGEIYDTGDLALQKGK